MGAPRCNMGGVADAVGCHRNTLERWRDTQAWEVTLRQADSLHVADLAPAAVAGLLRSWRRGNAAGAIDVLRAFGFLKPPAQGSITRDNRTSIGRSKN